MSPNSKIKVLALDLDGTLTNSQKQITPRTAEVLKKAAASGVSLVLASGRPVLGIRPLAAELEMDRNGGYILAFNGGRLVDARTGEVFHNIELSREVMKPICDYARKRGVALLTYSPSELWSESPENEFVKFASFTNRTTVHACKNLPDEFPHPLNKLLITADEKTVEAVEQEIKTLFGDRVDCFRSALIALEIVPKGVSKAAALEALLTHLDRERQELMAMGDGYNDLPMLEYAGFAVAMGNAVPEVKQKAHAVTLSNDEDGVAEAVERYILNKN